ncbi:hypothetical protein MUU53_06375 [Rhizobium lemnae]|uniref:Chromosomal replication initiator DnaA n=1 Tax=Rhizobium lemnae TaxID=1214924 RepID=A0ABV8E3C5_9HYPH|nr:hypothetical protein [Rhizobium lemnae]MCJ8507538.1 hypothetical protein [Rhizobium lemnae]
MLFDDSISASASAFFSHDRSQAFHSGKRARSHLPSPSRSRLLHHCLQMEHTVLAIEDLLPIISRSRHSVRERNSRLITLYLCHVVLGLSQVTVARIFGISRTSVREACQAVENSRDDHHLDVVLEIVGRLGARFAQQQEIQPEVDADE